MRGAAIGNLRLNAGGSHLAKATHHDNILSSSGSLDRSRQLTSVRELSNLTLWVPGWISPGWGMSYLRQTG